jgi:hypothetical protein
MSRASGQFTFQTPSSNAALGDDCSSTNTRRIFTATERCTITEFGCIAGDSAHIPNSSFTFKALTRVGGVAANDVVVDAYTAANAAEAGPSGNTKLTNGIVTNTVPSFLATANCLRAFCEVTLNKGDQLVIAVTAGGGASSTGIFYAKGYPCGAGIAEANDVDSN